MKGDKPSGVRLFGLPKPGRNFGTGFFVVAAVITLALAGPKVADEYEAADVRLPGLPTRGPARVVDGDTLQIAGKTFRLWGVDAPELATPEGRVSADYLTQVVATHEITCMDSGQRSYERIVGKCFDPWRRDLAAIMVAQGLAKDAPEFSGGDYADEEAQAAQAGRGFAAGAAVPGQMATTPGRYIVPPIEAYAGPPPPVAPSIRISPVETSPSIQVVPAIESDISAESSPPRQ